MLKAQAGFGAQDWQMCPMSQFMCVEVEEGFILRAFAHIVESIRVPLGTHSNSLYFSCLPFVLHLKITEPEQNTEGHVTGTVPAPQQILGKHSFPSSSLTPTFIKALFQMTASTCVWCVRHFYARSIAMVGGLACENAEMDKA